MWLHRAWVLGVLVLAAPACGARQTTASTSPLPRTSSGTLAAPTTTGSGHTPSDPIRACHAITPRTDYAAIATYRCPDGGVPLGGDPARGAAARLGNVGAGPDGHILDLYEVPCASGAVRLYVDMYHCPAGVQAEADPMHLTRGQLASVAQGIRSIHADVSSMHGFQMRRELLQWILETPQVSVVMCAGLGPLLPVNPSHPYMSELMLSMAAGVIEDGRDPADPVGVTTAGIVGMLVHYEAVVAAEGAGARLPELDRLLTAARDGSLSSLVASAVGGCDLTHMGVHF